MLKIIAMNTIKKKCEVVMLPTKKESGLNLFLNKLNAASTILSSRAGEIIVSKAQHLYILSDDKIEEGDWCLMDSKEIVCIEENHVIHLPNYLKNGDIKKIIATTDTSLKLYESETLARASGFSLKTDDILLPQPTQEFIEKYIEEYNKGNIITEVLVEYEQKQHFEADNSKRKDTRNGVWYKKRLKVSPKDNTITIYLVKDSWNREEISELKNLAITLSNHFDYIWNETSIRFDESLESKITKDQQRLAKWIEENL